MQTGALGPVTSTIGIKEFLSLLARAVKLSQAHIISASGKIAVQLMIDDGRVIDHFFLAPPYSAYCLASFDGHLAGRLSPSTDSTRLCGYRTVDDVELDSPIEGISKIVGSRADQRLTEPDAIGDHAVLQRTSRH